MKMIKLNAEQVLLYLLREVRATRRAERISRRDNYPKEIQQTLFSAYIQARNTYYGMVENIVNNYQIPALLTPNTLEKSKNIVCD